MSNKESKKERINKTKIQRQDRKLFKNKITEFEKNLNNFIKENCDEYLIIQEGEILDKLGFDNWHYFHNVKDFYEQIDNVFRRVTKKNKKAFYVTEIVKLFNYEHHEYRIYKSYVSQQKEHYKDTYYNSDNFLILNDDKNLSMTKLLKY